MLLRRIGSINARRSTEDSGEEALARAQQFGRQKAGGFLLMNMKLLDITVGASGARGEAVRGAEGLVLPRCRT